MTNEEYKGRITHDDMVDLIICTLRMRGFSLYTIEKDKWEPMKNVEITPNDKELFQKVITDRWYFGEVSDREKIRIDVIGCLHNGTGFLRDYSIAIEVSCSSDLRNEIIKLKSVPSKWKAVVTKDIEGELEGIPVIHFSKFERFLDGIIKPNVQK